MHAMFPLRASSAILAAFLLAWTNAPERALAAPESHVVREGETLSSIAARWGIEVDALVQTNGLSEPDRVVAGQTLRLSSSSPRTHEVQLGETLGAIASRYGLGTEELMAANQLPDPNRVTAGTILSLPEGSSTPPAASPSRPPGDREASPIARLTYLVNPGDTLSTIAHSFDTTVDALLAANSLADAHLLVVGQTLEVPARAIEHTVAPGETLAEIAMEYAVDLGSLVDFNGLPDADVIGAGDVLAIPDLGQHVPPPSAHEQTGAVSDGQAISEAEYNPPPAAGSNIGDTIVHLAHGLVGRPYVWGGSGEEGFDCSGLIWYVATQAGIDLSRGLLDQFNAGPNLERGNLQPGDLVFFQNTYMPGLSHNGIYVGDGRFVHASDERVGVTISYLDDDYWASRWFGATRVG